MKQLSGIDASFLYLETPTMHLHVVGVLVLDPSSNPRGYEPERIEEVVSERLHLLGAFRQRLVSAPAHVDHPVWIEDPDFELSHHLWRVTLPAPGGRVELTRFLGELAGRPLDRGKPLWELVVVDGLADGTIAVVSKLHHAIMSGPAGNEMMAHLLDLTPDATVEPPARAWEPEPVPSAPLLLAHSVRSRVGRVPDIPRAVFDVGKGLVKAAWLGVAQRGSGSPFPFTAPRTPFSGAITANRSVALGRCELDDLRYVKRAFETTINDVVLAATAASLRRYLLGRDALPSKPLVAAVPVAVTDQSGGTSSNPLSSMFVGLPVQLDDPVEQLHAVHANAITAKGIHGALGPHMLQEWCAFAPPSLMEAGARLYSGLRLASRHPPIYNLVVSNVAGPPVPLYCAGLRVVDMYPLGPVMDGTGINLTVLSHMGTMDLGLIACREMVSDPEAIVDGWIDAVAELRSAADRLHVG